MLPPSVTPLSFVVALLLVVARPSVSRPLSRRAPVSRSASLYHRFARRSFANLPPSHQQRSILSDEDGDLHLPDLDPASSDPINLRRSLDTDLEDPTFDANNAWNEFVALSSNEDSSYPDSFALEDQSDSPCSDSNENNGSEDTTSTDLPTSGGNGKVNPSASASHSESKPAKSNDSQPDKTKDSEGAKKKDAGAPPKPDAQADKQTQAEQAKQQQADAADQQQTEADKQKKAEADKQKKTDEEQQKAAEADEQKKADEDKQKEAEAAQAKKNAKQPPAPPKPDETPSKKAGPPANSLDNLQITDVKPIPGTPVTTGTAHKEHTADSDDNTSHEEHSGDATYYEPDLGACGVTNHSGEMIAAVSHLLYDSFPSQGGNPNTNAVCGKKIRATYQGRSVDVVVVDRCTGCDRYSLDFTITAFEKLGPKEEGRLHGMTWTFI